jgi:hypothetical protein
LSLQPVWGSDGSEKPVTSRNGLKPTETDFLEEAMGAKENETVCNLLKPN